MSGHKIFVSYKYADSQVENLSIYENSTVRNYVDEFELKLEKSDHIYKGESDGNDLSKLSEDQIWQKIKDKIFDSTLTIVFISPGMKELYTLDKNQWIPWEISFSLREQSRKREDGTSYTSNPNAVLGLVLPDINGSYKYFFDSRSCCTDGCTIYIRDNLFGIIKNNMFNKKNASKYVCTQHSEMWTGNDFCYIMPVKWVDFKKNINKYIDQAYDRQAEIDSYTIQVLV